MITKTHILCILLAAGVLLSGCSGASRQGNYRQEQGMAWGTVYHITYRSHSDLSDAITAAIDEINATLSPFVPTSEISRINSCATDSVGENFINVFNLSQRICSISDGAFDPTVAPLINLWGFGYGSAADNNEPDSAQITEALKHVGIMDCHVSVDGRLKKKTPGTEFNFSAIAKGYGVDKIAQVLKNGGCNDYLVEVGGEIAISGKSPRGLDWRIQIDAPVPDTLATTHERMAIIETTDCAVATSGNYRNYHLVAGRMMGHTISPTTGRPVSTNILSATIIAPECALADALATACMAVDDSTAIALIEATDDVEGLIVVACADTFDIKTTAGFPIRRP